jgi:bacterioferritin
MKGNEKTIVMLNTLLGNELAAVNQYILHAELCENWKYGKLRDNIKKRAIDEMKHVEQLIARILFFEGFPVVSQLGNITIGFNVPDIHKKDMVSESKTIGEYNAAIHLAQELGDSGTRELLESILTEEESHLDWIKGQHDQINQMGIENYLGNQI